MKTVFFWGSILLGCGLSIVASSCHQQKGAPSTQTVILKVGIDETVQPILQAEYEMYAKIYPNKKVQPRFMTEEEAITLFMQDSLPVIVVPRDLTEAQKKAFQAKHKFQPTSTPIAVDGIALIVNLENADTLVTWAQLQEIFQGKLKTWKELGASQNGAPIQVVLDKNRSSLVRYVQDSLLPGQTIASNVFAANSNEEVIRYVQKNKNTLGLIGFNWISDMDDSTVRKARDTFKMVGVKAKDGDKYVRLDSYAQHRLLSKTYPLQRTLYMINRDLGTTDASHFTAFVAGKDGQLIIHKATLLPLSSPIRLIELKEEKINLKGSSKK